MNYKNSDIDIEEIIKDWLKTDRRATANAFGISTRQAIKFIEKGFTTCQNETHWDGLELIVLGDE